MISFILFFLFFTQIDVTKDMKQIGELVIEVPVDEPLGAHNIAVTLTFGW